MSDNFPEVEAGLNRYKARFDQAAEEAIRRIGDQVYRNAKLNAHSASNPPTRMTSRNGKQYNRYNPHIGPRNGEGPNEGTGNLLTSMTYSTSRLGFGTYQATIGAGAVYARALELGNPRWASGVKYPYMEPALTQLVSLGQLSQIMAYAFRPLGG